VFQTVDFSSVNELKFTYVHLQFQNFFRGLYPWTPVIKGRGEEGGEERGGKEGRGWDEPSKKQIQFTTGGFSMEAFDRFI
jgi:hypothetical protein